MPLFISAANQSVDIGCADDEVQVHGREMKIKKISLWLKKFFTDTRALLARLFWLIAYGVLLFGLGFYLYEIYVKLSVSPDIMMNEKTIPSREIPMPAITVCSPLIIREDAFNMSLYLRGSFDPKNPRKSTLMATPYGDQVSESDINYLTSFISACYDGGIHSKIVRRAGNKIHESIVHTLNKASPGIEESFLSCTVGGFTPHCKNMLLRVLTDDGFCFTYNMVGYRSLFTDAISSDFDSYKRKSIAKSWINTDRFSTRHEDDKDEPANWTLEDGYTSEALDVQPTRAIKTLAYEVTPVMHDDRMKSACESRKASFKVLFHLPNEIPSPLHERNEVEIGDVKTIAFTAHVTHFDESLRGFTPQQRGCYHDHERKLRFFRHYTKSNCDYECLANYTLRVCKCVKFSMPRDSSTRVCDVFSIPCYQDAINNWPENYLRSSKEDARIPCECLQPCNNIQYSILSEKVAEMSEKNSMFKTPHLYLMGGKQNLTLTILKVIFNSNQIKKTENFMTYKLQNFIADVGGLCGLFMGTSILSFIEFLYERACALKKIKLREDNRVQELSQRNIIHVASR